MSSRGLAWYGLTFLIVPALTVWWSTSAAARLAEAEAAPDDSQQVAVASAADEGYCSPELKKILKRVLASCGLVTGGGGRGCQPMEAKSVAALSGADFNALFNPLAERAGILQFDQDSAELDEGDQRLLEQLFADQKGASWFFVVSRSSPEGAITYNQQLSQRRGNAVLDHLRSKFNDPDLDKEVGLLWLGEEFAQLDKDFCTWKRSGDPASCTGSELNRSAFVAWIDCRL
jgi:outer membrane protein OmpA-like peptidoglycan-associated protein